MLWHVLGESAEQPFGVLAEMVVGVIRFLDLQHFLFLRSQGFEDRPTVALGVDEGIPTKLRYHRGPRWQTSNGTLVLVDLWVYLALVVGGGHLPARLREAPLEAAYAYRG